MTKNTKITKYWAEIEINALGDAKIVKANKLTPLNQYKSKWFPTDARNLARIINNSDLIIN
jgi:hypothetical protein